MKNEKILVVDDDDALRELMVTHLERRGYAVTSARDGLSGLQMLEAGGRFDVLVTDLMMPYMNGVQLLREARRIDSRLEVIVVTAGASVDSAIASMREDGAFDYLIKPFETISELSMAVARALAFRELQLERDELQARLAAEVERLQLVIAHIEDAILSADADGKLTVVNPAAVKLICRDDLVGRDALAYLPRSVATIVAEWQASGEQRPVTVEVAWSAGTTQLLHLSPMRRDGARANGWVMTVRDVTHLKQLDKLKSMVNWAVVQG
jgi:PAS domain S-box-containing protein